MIKIKEGIHKIPEKYDEKEKKSYLIFYKPKLGSLVVKTIPYNYVLTIMLLFSLDNGRKS